MYSIHTIAHMKKKYIEKRRREQKRGKITENTKQRIGYHYRFVKFCLFLRNNLIVKLSRLKYRQKSKEKERTTKIWFYLFFSFFLLSLSVIFLFPPCSWIHFIAFLLYNFYLKKKSAFFRYKGRKNESKRNLDLIVFQTKELHSGIGYCYLPLFFPKIMS